MASLLVLTVLQSIYAVATWKCFGSIESVRYLHLLYTSDGRRGVRKFWPSEGQKDEKERGEEACNYASSLVSRIVFARPEPLRKKNKKSKMLFLPAAHRHWFWNQLAY